MILVRRRKVALGLARFLKAWGILKKKSRPSWNVMQQAEAAKRLGISITALKQVCRKLGITRWPYHRPCKRGSRYRSRTKQDAIAIDESDATKQPRTDDAYKRACLADASMLCNSSHPELAPEGIFRSNCHIEGMSQLWSSSYAASMATDHTAPIHVLAEDIRFMALDADEDDLGWLVSSDNMSSCRGFGVCDGLAPAICPGSQEVGHGAL